MTLCFLNDNSNDAESTQKIKNYVIIACLKSESVGRLINRIPDSRLLISSLLGSALKALPGKFDIKRHSRSILCIMIYELEEYINRPLDKRA